jgi:hypothetical protein
MSKGEGGEGWGADVSMREEKGRMSEGGRDWIGWG